MKEKALLIDIVSHRTNKEECELRFSELDSLVTTYGGLTVLKAIQKRSQPDYKTYVGSGKVEELLDSIGDLKNLDVLIVNNILKPSQIYNLEEFCIDYQIKKYEAAKAENPDSKIRFETPKKIKVWDRVDLILKIFDKHATTAEAKLQIELASIKHMGPRIFGMGLELSRQAGGIGTLGVGETNIEIMKRHLKKRLQTIQDRLKQHSNVQKRHREARRDKNLKTVSIAGYTNAGKSTLSRALTKKDLYVADALFATLDSRAGELFLPQSRTKAIVTDTIGFIQDLPPDLIDAFKSTLAEVIEANLILHVIDISDENMVKKIQVVEDILDSLGCNGKNKIYVFNKMDLLDKKIQEGKMSEEDKINLEVKIMEDYGEFKPQFVSALDKKSLENLIKAIESQVVSETSASNQKVL